MKSLEECGVGVCGGGMMTSNTNVSLTEAILKFDLVILMPYLMLPAHTIKSIVLLRRPCSFGLKNNLCFGLRKIN